MKRIVAVFFLSLLTAFQSPAAPAQPGTLVDYIALGSGGATIGGVLFSNFTLQPLQSGGMAINPALVQVNPINVSGMPSLQFVFNAMAAAGQVLELAFSYNVSNASIFGTSLAIAGAIATADGAVIGTVDLNGPSPKPGTLIAFATANDAQLADQNTFGAVPFVTTFADFVIDGGTSGQSALSSAVIGHSAQATQAVPEAGPTFVLALLASAFCLFGHFFLTSPSLRRAHLS